MRSNPRVLAQATSPPTRELGLMKPEQFTVQSAMSWLGFTDDVEYVPDLKWPGNVKTYDKMRTDSQLAGLYRAMTFPIRRYKFMINPNGARPDVVEGIANDLNLDVQGQDPRPRGRQQHRFSFDKHLYTALLAGIYGHMYFEQVGEIREDGLWHLKKLAPRMPHTISQINVADDGGLISIKQKFTKVQGGAFATLGGVEIPVDYLVAYITDQEGANWSGRSWLRDCYRNWLIKDRLLRVDAINHEKAGGVPIAKAQPGASPNEIAQLSKLAQSFKVGEESGGAIPAAADFQLYKAGSGTDVVTSIRYHDESMARYFLHMFIQLGQTETGSRALGQAFIEYAFIAQKAVAQWFVDVTNEHVIEDWVDWNYGVDEQIPLLTYVVEADDGRLAVADLVSLIGAGAITVDDDLQNALRQRFKLPLASSTASVGGGP